MEAGCQFIGTRICFFE